MVLGAQATFPSFRSRARRFAAIVSRLRFMFARHWAIRAACAFFRSASSRSRFAAYQAADHAARPLPGGVQLSQ
jgi:hypothetical protein